ncbi:MAG TPA: helix-turn-helix domain-containing protein [Actinomycetota bacterium]|nr:helix-turn-helix domain-containing protein [Actinomycetota bacterium]
MRSREEVSFVLELVRAGWNDCAIARETGIPRGTVRDWRSGRSPGFERTKQSGGVRNPPCPVCRGGPLTLPQIPYRCLLGLHLGDGCQPVEPVGRPARECRPAGRVRGPKRCGPGPQR